MNIYQEELLDHVKSPRNYGKLEDAYESEDSNPACGDSIKVYIKLNKEMKVEEVAFEGAGCAVSQGSASILLEEIKDKNLSALKKMTEEDFFKLIGIELSPSRKRCALVSFKALKQIIEKIDSDDELN